MAINTKGVGWTWAIFRDGKGRYASGTVDNMPKGIYLHKPSSRKGISLPEEIKRKISEGMKGKKNALGRHWSHSEETKRKMAQAHTGKKLSEEIKRKMSLAQKERYKDENERIRNTKIKLYKNNYWLKTRISNSVKKLWQNPQYRQAHIGPNHPWWKGGLTKREETLAHALRVELRNWAKEVLERDNYTCQECGKKFDKKFLHTHHIKPISKNPSLALDVSNGITLCKNCHFTTESFGRKLEKSAKILLNTEKRQFINKISNNS